MTENFEHIVNIPYLSDVFNARLDFENQMD